MRMSPASFHTLINAEKSRELPHELLLICQQKYTFSKPVCINIFINPVFIMAYNTT